MRKKGFVAVMMAMVLLAGCGNADDAVRERYLKESVRAADSITSESEAEEKFDRLDQSDIAEKNAEEIYDIYRSENDRQFKHYLTLYSEPGDMPLSKKLVLQMYSVYATVRQWAPIIGIASIVVGIIVFMLSRYNLTTRKFALFGLIIGVPLLLVFIVYGYAILIDIYMY